MQFLCVVVAHCVNKISVTDKLCKNRYKPERKTNNNIYLECDLLIMLLILHTEDYCKSKSSRRMLGRTRKGFYAKRNENKIAVIADSNTGLAKQNNIEKNSVADYLQR